MLKAVLKVFWLCKSGARSSIRAKNARILFHVLN